MENFLHFICPWLRVRGCRIFLLVLFSIITVKVVVNAQSDSMCYQGKIITTEAQTISLSKKSLSNFSLQKCQAPTTEEPEPELTTTTTDILTTTSNIQSSSSTMDMETDMPTTVNTSSKLSSTDGFSPTDMTTTTSQDVTTNPIALTTITTSLSPSGNGTISDKTSTAAPTNGRRRRQDDDDDDDRNFFCNVFYYPTSKDTSLKVISTYTLDFSCATEDLCEGKGKLDTKIGDQDGTLYCCNGTACNSPLVVIDDRDTEVEVETLKNCSSYNQTGILQSVPCVGVATHMCLNITQKGANTTEYTCGNSISEEKYCMENGWFSERCSKTAGTTTCCYVEPTFVEVPPEVKQPNSSVGVIIGVLVAFATGLFLGCIGLVILQKKCGKGRTSGIEMDFSYSRFQSADSGTDEL